MTQAIELPLPQTRTGETKFVATICFVHFASHYYITLLAPLFLFVRADYGVSYTELGLAYTAFNVVSTALQTPAGFLVDRVSARALLVAGLIIGAVAFAIAAAVDSFFIFVAMFALAGLGNTVYHPADYALLSRHVPTERAGRAFSLHTFAGMLGNAAAPPTLLFLQSLVGWRGAFLGASALGLVAALVMGLSAEPAEITEDQAGRKPRGRGAQAAAGGTTGGWRVLLAPAILLNLAFFIMLAISSGALYNFLVPALGALHGTPIRIGNAALTALLTLSPLGVLVGGWLAGRTAHHGLVATCGLMMTAGMSLLVASLDLATALLIGAMGIAGFFSGLTMPSRDMIVRTVTPPGAYGRVFGFVSTGFNIGGIVAPMIFGQLLDKGYPRAIFFCVAAAALVSITTVAINTTRKPATTSA
ncbi:MAG TPA: MFS transporter [Xanthobacteraceae bacterium]|nr:MFS transporter [Xanthobacteraceae bacterium]